MSEVVILVRRDFAPSPTKKANKRGKNGANLGGAGPNIVRPATAVHARPVQSRATSPLWSQPASPMRSRPASPMRSRPASPLKRPLSPRPWSGTPANSRPATGRDFGQVPGSPGRLPSGRSSTALPAPEPRDVSDMRVVNSPFRDSPRSPRGKGWAGSDVQHDVIKQDLINQHVIKEEVIKLSEFYKQEADGHDQSTPPKPNHSEQPARPENGTPTRTARPRAVSPRPPLVLLRDTSSPTRMLRDVSTPLGAYRDLRTPVLDLRNTRRDPYSLCKLDALRGASPHWLPALSQRSTAAEDDADEAQSVRTNREAPALPKPPLIRRSNSDWVRDQWS